MIQNLIVHFLQLCRMKTKSRTLHLILFLLFLVGSSNLAFGQKKVCFDADVFEVHDFPVKYLDVEVVKKCLKKKKFKKNYSKKVKEWIPVINAYDELNSPRAEFYKKMLLKELESVHAKALEKQEDMLLDKEDLAEAKKEVRQLEKDIEKKEKAADTDLEILEEAKEEFELLLNTDEEGQPTQKQIDKEKKKVDSLERAYNKKIAALEQLNQDYLAAEKKVKTLSKKSNKSAEQKVLKHIANLENLMDKINNL